MLWTAVAFQVAVAWLSNSLPGQQPESPLVSSFKRYQHARDTTPFGFEWVSVGPLVNSARVESVQLDPRRPGTMYVAFGSGGLWKTVNNGMSWEPKFEGHASYGIGDIALAPSNPDIIYLGTGESLKKARNFTIPGTGVYRSDDGGETWRHLGLDDSWHIGEIAVHPTDPDTALVAVLGHFWSTNTHRGLYRTSDGGRSWQQVLHIDEKTGANDITWGKNDPNFVYASMWENNPGVCGKNSGVYRSQDAGQTWQRCVEGLPSGEQIGRIGLAVSQQDAAKVYALVDDREQIANDAAARIFRSEDGGRTWKQTHQDPLMIFSRIGWYFADIYVDPDNDDEIYALGVRLAHSTDGGQTFELMSGEVNHLVPSAATGLHLDHCEMWIHPENSDHLVLGNDGGLYQSYDRGKTWLHYNNLPTGEFYDLELAASNTSTPPLVFAGAQDNATVFGYPEELGPTRSRPWKYLWIDPWNGGDGCVTVVDEFYSLGDKSGVFFSAQEGAFRRVDPDYPRAVGIRPAANLVEPAELKFNFVAPMIKSDHGLAPLYLGGNFLFKSDSAGEQWQVISPDLTKSSDPKKKSVAATAIAESKLEDGTLYVGTDRGAMWVSEDGGASWQERSAGLPVGYVRSICVTENAVYVTLSGLNYDDLNTYVFRSEDRGETWRSIAGNLSNEPANVILDHGIELFLGTFRGVYISRDDGESWHLLGKNLPVCSVSDMSFSFGTEKDPDSAAHWYGDKDELIVATHGRGIYKVDLSPLERDTLAERDESQQPRGDFLFPPRAVYLPGLSDTRPGFNFQPPEKMTITYRLENAASVRLSIETEDGTELTSFELEGQRGYNQFRWDLVTKTTDSPKPYHVNYRTFIKAGQYTIKLKTPASDEVFEQALKVIQLSADQNY